MAWITNDTVKPCPSVSYCECCCVMNIIAFFCHFRGQLDLFSPNLSSMTWTKEVVHKSQELLFCRDWQNSVTLNKQESIKHESNLHIAQKCSYIYLIFVILICKKMKYVITSSLISTTSLFYEIFYWACNSLYSMKDVQFCSAAELSIWRGGIMKFDLM